jgi:hypothetical protein
MLLAVVVGCNERLHGLYRLIVGIAPSKEGCDDVLLTAGAPHWVLNNLGEY